MLTDYTQSTTFYGSLLLIDKSELKILRYAPNGACRRFGETCQP
jgi:hypothetical protein